MKLGKAFKLNSLTTTTTASKIIYVFSEKVPKLKRKSFKEFIVPPNKSNKLLSRSGHLILFSISVDKNSFEDYVF